MENITEEYKKQRNESIDEELSFDKVTKCKRQKNESIVYGVCVFIGIIIILFCHILVEAEKKQIPKYIWALLIIATLIMIVMTIIASRKYKKLRNEISMEILEEFLKKKFIVKKSEKELEEVSEEEQVDDVSKYEPEKFIPEEELEQYLQEMEEIPEEIPKEEVIYEEINHYFEEHFEIKYFKNFIIEKYGKTLDICKIDCSEYRNEHRYDYDIYYLKIDVTTQKELYIREVQANYKKSTFENSIIECRSFSVNSKKKEREQDYDKYELTQTQKEILVQAHKKYRLNFKIAIKDGYFMLFAKKMKSITLKNELKTNYDFVQCIDEIIKEFINI